ncbi:MAG: LptF/LptG family permease [bacterium]|nr:LptF/LptG family permease [bacterium]
MKILDKYLIINFLKPLFYSIVTFAGIMLVTDIFETANTLISAKVSLSASFKYFFFKIPQIITLILPVSVLLATLFSLSKLFFQNEITAMKANCITVYRIFAPILILTFTLSILNFFWNETIVTRANRITNIIKQTQIKKINIKYNEAYNISIHLSSDQFLKLHYLNKEENIMENINLLYYTPQSSLKMRIDAKYAKWNDNKWSFCEGIKRKFNSFGELISESQFEKEVISISKSPEDILEIVFFERREPEEISFLSLQKYIAILKKSGSNVTNYLVELHMKLSFPMISFIISLIGASLALLASFRGNIAGFGLSIFISFIYWGTMAVGRSLGRSEILSPFLATWIANFIYGSLGIYLIIKVKK